MGDKVWLLLDYLNPVLSNIAQKERGNLSGTKQANKQSKSLNILLAFEYKSLYWFEEDFVITNFAKV